MLVILLLCVLVAASSARGALFQQPTEDILNKAYDFIVVGAGAAGSVMASRLSEDAGTSVLLIEAGGRLVVSRSDFTNQNILVPGFSATLSNSQFDWNFTTTTQTGLNNRSIKYPRGHVLGGSTAINQMEYCRGTKDDFDRWANITGDDGWSWEKLQPFMLKVQRMTLPADQHDTSGQFNPAIHGSTGPVATSVEGFSLGIDARGLHTTSQLPGRFPFNLDYNSGDTIGISWTQSTIENGHRVTAASAYLAPALNRSNLDILVNTQVTKVLPVSIEIDGPVMRRIQFAQSANGTAYTLNATKEIILSAGAVKSPHILMLSGIGDAAYLSSMGTEPLVNLTGVGQNLQDHVFLASTWTVNSTTTLDNLKQNATLAAAALDLWKINGTGPLGLSPANQFGWLRVPANASTFEEAPDPSAGPTSAHFELILSDNFVSKAMPPPSEGHFFSMLTNLISPASRGNITLSSLSPFDPPLIDPNLLNDPRDLSIMVHALAAARAFVAAPAWDGYILSEFGAFANATTRDGVEAYVRANADTVDHVVGTAAMGRGAEAVLDARLRVRGTVGLRVVDASAFPFIISGHTQGPTYMLAERAADIVRGLDGTV
ncbi:alcohol oxidase [Amylostereum chailletii]|nr:alcohol oxidase [Amylostereum chailletii]